MFGKKKRKKSLFGAGIEPSCQYCRRNGGRQGKPALCTLHLEPKDGRCKKYEYDPLRREPRTAPSLRDDRYSQEDFKL